MEQTELKANGLCLVFKTNKLSLDLWKTAILKRVEYICGEIICVRIICDNKFDSVKLQVTDKDDMTTIYSIHFWDTGSITVQRNYVSQWCDFEDLRELINKLKNSDINSIESLITSALCETPLNNTSAGV